MTNLNKLTKDLNFEKIDEVFAKGALTTSSCSSSTLGAAGCPGIPDQPPVVPPGPVGPDQ